MSNNREKGAKSIPAVFIDGLISHFHVVWVYNHLLETQIDECFLIDVLSKKKFSMPLLRFAMKGTQYDEYNAYSQIENRDIYSKRNFNCLIDVALKEDDVFVHNILIDQHVDDYIMLEYRLYDDF